MLATMFTFSLCFQDTALPLKLIQKLGIFTGLMEMSQACHIPAEWVLLKGQGVRLWSILVLVTA